MLVHLDKDGNPIELPKALRDWKYSVFIRNSNTFINFWTDNMNMRGSIKLENEEELKAWRDAVIVLGLEEYV